MACTPLLAAEGQGWGRCAEAQALVSEDHGKRTRVACSEDTLRGTVQHSGGSPEKRQGIPEC